MSQTNRPIKYVQCQHCNHIMRTQQTADYVTCTKCHYHVNVAKNNVTEKEYIEQQLKKKVGPDWEKGLDDKEQYFTRRYPGIFR